MRLYLFILFLCAAVATFAQDDVSWEVNHYEKTRTFVEDGYTYQCDVKYGEVTLYNAANQWTYADQIDNRTGKLYTSNLGENDVTGDLAEVCFNFSIFEASARIPISYYRDIELQLKEQVRVKVLEGGKHLTYLMTCVTHAPEGRLSVMQP